MSLMEDGAFTVAFDVDNKEHGILFVLHQDIADDEFALLQILSQTRYFFWERVCQTLDIEAVPLFYVS